MSRLCPVLVLFACAAEAADRVAAELGRGIAFLERRVASDPDDFVAANQLVDRLLRRLNWTGRLDDLRRADEVAALSLRAMPAEQNAGGLVAQARVFMAVHRFSEARDAARKLGELIPGKATASQVLGDALVELGDLDGAQRAYDEAQTREDASIATEARFARLAWLRGRLDEAARRLDAALAFARASSDPETLVWALVQRGEHAFRRGDHGAAEKLYGEAQALAPSHWSVIEHLAELRGTQGRDAEAAQLFEQAARASGRPELWQALGDLHAFYQRPAEAKAAHDRALAGYRASLDRGEVLYVHHLAGFFSDSQPDAAQAVVFARQDLQARATGAAFDAFAWALYRLGDFHAAEEASARALATGLADAHVLHHAATIHLSSGAVQEGQALLRRCAEVNPHFAGFHVHR